MSSPPLPSDTTEGLFHGYSPPAHVFDEWRDANGPRPHWQAFTEKLESVGPRELRRRWEQTLRQIVNQGVTYHPRGEDSLNERPWKLDAIPFLLPESQWQELEAGLAQRAVLFDLMLRDLFGPQMLLKERLVPPVALYGHPGFQPAYHGLTPPPKHHLHVFASDLSRAPDGKWWVTGDRTRSPFGLGYVLENRLSISRMLPNPFRQYHVHRLAKFFIQLQQLHRSLAARYHENPRIVLWSEGPESMSYFEDAYLARYLGYTLAEGGDLAVRENRVMLKTLGGLLPVEVLFRRLNDDACDPVELAPRSTLGVSGLTEVIRSGNVAVSNGLGSRLVESPIFLAFLPKICQLLLGEPLKLPSVATWWCGDDVARKHVLGNLDKLMIRHAFRMTDEPPICAESLTAAERNKLIENIQSEPAKFVGQERVQRSTSPTWHDGHMEAWPLSLRCFLVARNGNFEAMPGGLARVAPHSQMLDRSQTGGERSQDVWILSDQPVEHVSLLTPPGTPVTLRRSGGELPSRVADNLFWLGRHVERAEGSARLLRTILTLLIDERDETPELTPLLRALSELGQIEPDYVVRELQEQLPSLEEVLPVAVFDRNRNSSLRSTISAGVRVASIVRDRIAVDAWRIIRRIDETCRWPKWASPPTASEAIDVLDQVITELAALAGLASESMTRAQGWRFLDLGRRLERAWQSCLLFRSTLVEPIEAETSLLEAVMSTVDGIMTYRSRYLANVQIPAVLDLLLVDKTNPRSVQFQLDRIVQQVEQLPRDEQQAVLSPELRLALSMQNSLRLADVFELSQVHQGRRQDLYKLLTRLEERLPKLADAVSGRFLIHAGLQRHFASSTRPEREL